jgi:carboxypeptidase Taq
MANTALGYAELIERVKRTGLLGSCGSVLGWDRETYMPRGGAEHRAEQLSLLAGLAHESATNRRIGELLSELMRNDAQTELTDAERACVRDIHRDFTRATCLPKQLVEAISHTTALAQQHWVDARKASDFSQFAPWLEKIVALKQEEAAAIGFPDTGCAYDALLHEFEPNASAAEIEVVFDALRSELTPLIEQIRESSAEAPVEILKRHYPQQIQQQFASAAAATIGFDFECGRIDIAAHPFCSGFGPGDCRLTTRYDENFFSSAFFGTLHEAGHGMYEQGLLRDHYGTPRGTACSLGVHESQSRLWENIVGRSDAFWTHFFPLAQQAFPQALTGTSRGEFVFAINHAAPTFIRVEADEVTYNLHVMLRFDIERALVAGDLLVHDLPGAWNDRFSSDFGITPPDDAFGCLQDVHWSAGLFGYFPTYTLGNIYASQLFAAFERECGSPQADFAKGQFGPLKDWLRKTIHEHGQRFTAPELIQRATGEKLNQQPLVDHLKQRFLPLYA